nr:MAG TPA: Terminase [Caudoviricetes sp.]DAU14554.1 MAG TPA: Terminase [Caudoviricetes sp.]
MNSELNQLIDDCEKYISQNGIDENIIETYYNVCQLAKNESEIDTMLKCTARAKELINGYCTDPEQFDGKNIWEVEKVVQESDSEYPLLNQFYDVLKLESYYNFESFMFYMERKRHWTKRFYFPRRKTLKVVVKDLEDLENRIIKFYGLSMPSRVGKSTICIFFLAWVSLRRPNSHSAMGGHSGILAKGFYKELMNLFTTEEYTFSELFYFWNPEYAKKPLVTDKSADEFTITLGNPDRFATVTCRGIDGTWTGAVDVSKDGYLYVDDLVRDREHSLSPMRMENTYQEYLNKMVDRKNDGARELMVGTLWNVLDPLERMRKRYENDPQYRFRRIPALNENDESNFDYEINGFSTAYYKDMREKLDKAEWMAKFMQKPYVREGLLFPDNELRFFNGDFNDELENKERKIIALCDPAFGGADNLSMPVCADFGGKQKYIIDWVYKKGTQAVTVPLVVAAIKKHYITELHIEQNAGGKLITDSIKAEMKKQNVYFCRIIPYYANTKLPKEEKIKGYSDRVKETFIFLMSRQYLAIDDRPTYIRTQMYQDAMDEFTMYTSEGKNPHDDASDSITQLAIVIDKKATQTVIMSSPI